MIGESLNFEVSYGVTTSALILQVLHNRIQVAQELHDNKWNVAGKLPTSLSTRCRTCVSLYKLLLLCWGGRIKGLSIATLTCKRSPSSPRSLTNFSLCTLAVLGLHSLLTQQQSFKVESEKLGEAIKKFGLRKPGEGKKTVPYRVALRYKNRTAYLQFNQQQGFKVRGWKLEETNKKFALQKVGRQRSTALHTAQLNYRQA